MGNKFPFLMFIFLYCFIIISGYAYPGIIPENVYLEEIHIGGLTKQEALQKVCEHFKRINFNYQNFSCSLTPEELGIAINYEKSFEELEKNKIWQKVVMNFQETQFSLVKEYNLSKMRQALEVIDSGVSLSPQNADLEIVEEKILTKPGIKGTKLEDKILIKNITESTLKNSYIIPVIVVNPFITEEDLEDLKPLKLLAEYTTIFVKNYNRTENIRLASEAIKNTLLAPGEIFSFNDVVGPREEERGYLSAMIIQGGDFIPGLGGGICQVSSTLYNSVLLANLEIVERHSHSLKIDYVPAGQDATVAYGFKDFRFKNNTDGYLRLDYNIEGQNLTISIYGAF